MIGVLILTSIVFGGCSDKDSERESASVTDSVVYTEPVTEENVLPDGIYMAEFDTDSSMFRVNEAHANLFNKILFINTVSICHFSFDIVSSITSSKFSIS